MAWSIEKMLDNKKQIEKIKRNHSEELKRIAQAVEKDPSKLLEFIAKLDSKLAIVQSLAQKKTERQDLIVDILAHMEAIENDLKKLHADPELNTIKPKSQMVIHVH